MRTTPHPYMANSVPAIKQEMLDAIGASSIEELFAQIPNAAASHEPLQLPPGDVVRGRPAPPPARHAGASTTTASRA